MLHVLIQFHGALLVRNAHITIYDITTRSWVNLVNSSPDEFSGTEECFLEAQLKAMAGIFQ